MKTLSVPYAGVNVLRHTDGSLQIEDRQFGNETVHAFPMVEVNLSGANWDMSYMDNPMQEEYALVLKDRVTNAAVTMWFTSPMKRKEFLSITNTRERVNQDTTGMVFNHLSDVPKRLSRSKRWVFCKLRKLRDLLEKVLQPSTNLLRG